MHIYPVILSGGSGTRLWPMSREASPKQLLPLLRGRTLFQCALGRLRGTRLRLENPGKIPLEIIETQTGAYLAEDDIVRIEDAYHRA